MTDLPPGWAMTTLGEIAESVKNGIFVSRPGAQPNGVPILRINAVRPGQLRVSEVRYSELDEGALSDTDSLLLEGDLLFTRYNGNIDYVGACATVPYGVGPLTYPDKLIRVRVDLKITDPRYVAHAFASPGLRSQIAVLARTTAGQVGISGASLKNIAIPMPSLTEQHRIVEVLEDHLSRLDVATTNLIVNRLRLTRLTKRVLIDAVPIPAPKHWEITTVGAAGKVDLGRQRHPDWHSGPHMRPYLRVANVFEDRIDLSDVMAMDFPPDIFERFRLAPGDILLNEGQSPELLGRPAMYRGNPPEIAFTNSLLRFRVGPGIEPDWALLVFRRHMHAGRFVREVRITTNIAHLSAGRFKSVEFPIPPLDEQRRIVARARDHLGMINRVADGLTRAQRRASHLRESLLTEAFAGRLVPQDPSDEPAWVLLERIKAEREATQPSAVRRRAPRARRTNESVPVEAKDTLW